MPYVALCTSRSAAVRQYEGYFSCPPSFQPEISGGRYWRFLIGHGQLSFTQGHRQGFDVPGQDQKGPRSAVSAS
jgi:hypothetical protein